MESISNLNLLCDESLNNFHLELPSQQELPHRLIYISYSWQQYDFLWRCRNKLAVSLQSSENVLKLFNMITRTQCQICQLWIFKKVWQYHLLIFSQCKSRLTGIYLMSHIQLCYSNQKSHIRCIHLQTRQMVTEIYNYFPIEMQIPLNNSGLIPRKVGDKRDG